MSPMRVLFFQPGIIRPLIYHIEGDLSSMQKTVGGYIETVSLPDGLVIVCDEEARLKGLPPNRIVDGVSICGPFFICKRKRDKLVELSFQDACRLRDQQFQRCIPAQYATT